jgi:putative ABC transport system permease protein
MTNMPDWTAEVRARLASVRLSPEREAEIADELSQHLEDAWRDRVAGGASADEATRAVRATLSNDNLLAKYLTPLRQARWKDPAPPAAARGLSFQGVAADLRLAVRTLRTSPGFAIATLLVLALGTGATTAIFSVVDAVVLRGLPFEAADRLVAVGERGGGKNKKASSAARAAIPIGDPGDPQALSYVQPQNYLDWVAQQQVFDAIAAITVQNEDTLVVAGGQPEAILRHRVTASFFEVLRVRPALGRAFTTDNEVDGRDGVVVLSDAFWERRFAGDPAIVGRTVQVNGATVEIIGVMPRGFTYPVGAVRPAEMWSPYVVPEAQRTRARGISMVLQCIARLKPGVSVTQAQAQMDQVAAAIERANPGWPANSQIGLRPLRDHIVGASTQSWLLMLLTAVGIVLLIACINVANLWLARAAARERDFAVRAALGASRWRLIRQWLVESLLVSVVGTALGVLLALELVRLLKAAMPEDIGRVASIAIDLRVLVMAAALAIVTGVLSGIVPALQSSGVRLTSALNQGAREGGASRSRRRLRSALVLAEVALAVILLVGAVLFIGSFINVMRLDLGVGSEGVLTMQIFPRREATLPAPQDLGPAFDEIVTRLRQLPGVASAAAVYPGAPLRFNLWVDGLHVDGKTIPGEAPGGMTAVSLKSVTPGYWSALSIPVRSGRVFNDNDRAGSDNVIILSESAARLFFAGEEAVGRTAILQRVERRIVGVVADVRQSSVERNPLPEVYVPMRQLPRTSYGYLVVRTHGEPLDALPAARAVVASVMPQDPLRYIATMDELIAAQTATRRLNMTVLTLLGALALVISSVGVFGITAYLVAQRTREIGVRMALGASRGRVVGMVLRHTTGLVIAGLVLGSTAAWYFVSAAGRFLYGLDAHDPRAFIAPALIVLIASVIATILPARRAAGVDPAIALRSE